MHLPKRMWSAMSASTAALAILAGGLAGCSGGGASTVTPIPQNAAPTTVQRDTETVGLSVDPGAASAVAALTSDAHAHAYPLAGHRASGNARHAMTGGFYDLVYYGGPYVTSASNHNIYINCSAGNCWGSVPSTFVNNYSNSSMIHITDQYVHTTANNRYPAGTSYAETYSTSGTLQDQDIYNMVYAAAKLGGTGYGHMYHVFLKSGVQQCSSSAGGCYAVQYCAYHGSVNFSDIGHVLYSVEPYQGISGCSVGTLTNSTSSTLSHEETEIITDADVAQNNLAWYNNSGGEIGDICAGSNGNVSLNGTTYYIQSEYSNRTSTCRWAP